MAPARTAHLWIRVPAATDALPGGRFHGESPEPGGRLPVLGATPPSARADALRACDTPFWNDGLCATGSSSALSPAPSGSARARRPSPSPASGSQADAFANLPGVVARVDHVEAHPLLDGQVAHARMLHEEIVSSLRQQRAVYLIPHLDCGQKMRLRGGAIDLQWRCRAFGRLAARRKPAESEDEQLRDLLSGSAGPSFHRRVVPACQKCLRTQGKSQRQVLDDLRRCPLSGGPALPLAVRTPLQRTEHENRQLTDRGGGGRGHCLKNRRRTWSPCSSHSSNSSGGGRTRFRYQKRNRPPPATS